MKEINIATVFSGIGSPEQALRRLNVPHKVLFACDNGERMISIDHDKEFSEIKKLETITAKRKYVDELYSKCSRQTNYVQNYSYNYT